MPTVWVPTMSKEAAGLILLGPLTSYYKIQGYGERVQTRTEKLPQVRTQALQQVALVDKAIEEFTQAIEKAIWDITQYAKKTKRELQEMRTELSREIETALEEVERTLVEDKPRLTSRLGSVFRALAENLQPFQLFSFSLNTSSALTVVTLTSKLQLSQAAVQTQASQPVQQPPKVDLILQVRKSVLQSLQVTAQIQLVVVTASFYRFYDFQRMDWKPQIPLNPHIEADEYSSWVILEGGRVFICGGEGLSTAYIVGDGWEKQGRMHEARKWHGVLAYSNHTVYVFGGGRKYTLFNSCEKYQLQQHTWTLLQPMKAPRYKFNPCLFNGNIYLCGYGSEVLEAFSPQNDQMLSFQLTMPAGTSSSCCMYVEDTMLVVHLKYNILRFRTAKAEQLIETSRQSTVTDAEWQNSQPVVNTALNVFYIVQYGTIYSVNMDSGATS